MFFFVVLGIVIFAALVLAVMGLAAQNTGGAIAAVVGGLLIAGLTWGVFSFNHVDHREVAIVTTFGKYDGVVSQGGVHWLKPWSSIEKFDKTIQPTTIEDVSVSFSDGGEDGRPRIGGGKGLIDNSTHWQMSGDENGAKLLWEKYRTFDATQAFVNRAARDATIEVANSYDAATAIISLDEMGTLVEESLREELDAYGIVVDSVKITAIDLDAGTQAAVDKLFTTQQDIQRAQNEQVRAQIDSETVEIREAAGALSPAANQRYCLDLVNAWDVGKNGSLPATFNCNFSGSSDEVIVNTP